MLVREFKIEEKQFILDCLACGYAYWEIQEEFVEEFDRKAPCMSAISGYRHRYTDEIERRRALFIDDLKESGLPYVRQCERVKRYGRFAKIEMRRKRYESAAVHLERIAKETGDIKTQHELTGKNGGPIDIRSIPSAELDQGIAERLAHLTGSADEADDPGAARQAGEDPD